MFRDVPRVLEVVAARAVSGSSSCSSSSRFTATTASSRVRGLDSGCSGNPISVIPECAQNIPLIQNTVKDCLLMMGKSAPY